MGMSAPVASAAPLVIPPDGTREVRIPMCVERADMDCIESVSVVRAAQRIRPQLVSSGFGIPTLWSYPSQDSGEVTFSLDAHLKPTGVVESWGGRVPGARFWVRRQSDARNPFRTEANLDCTTGIPADCTIGHPPLPDGDRIEIAYRSSWIRPLNVAVRGRDLKYRTKSIDGGTLFVLSASQDRVPRVVEPNGTPIDQWTADAWISELAFIIDHAGSSSLDSAYDPKCAPMGAPVAGQNSTAAGRPFWDQSSNSLNFNIYAPHRGPDGGIYRGLFQAQIPMSWLRCESGRSDLRANGFTISVVSEDGEEQVATTALRVRNRTLYVQAFGFHYSAPTVQLVSKY